jgi:hypothetical protein
MQEYGRGKLLSDTSPKKADSREGTENWKK